MNPNLRFPRAAPPAALVAALLLTLVVPGRALALVYGNPVPRVLEGETAVGASFTDDRATGFADIGVGPDGVAQGSIALVDLGAVDGVEVGGAYKHRLSKRETIREEGFGFGLLAFARYGEVDGDNVEVTYLELDVGAGITFVPRPELEVFGGPIYRRLQVDTETPGRGDGRQTDTDLGIFVGAEYWVQPQAAIGIEFKVEFDEVFDEDVGAYILYKF